MRKAILFLTAVLLNSISPSQNYHPSKICYYPKRCNKIISAEFSIGTGSSSIQYVELTCINNKGELELLVDRFFSIGGLLGFGRVSMPTWIKFKNKN